MPTFAQKQNQPQQPSSGNLARSNMVSPVASHAHDVLHLQRTIGSQAVLRLLQARAEGFEARTDIEVNSEIPATTRFALRTGGRSRRRAGNAHARVTATRRLLLWARMRDVSDGAVGSGASALAD